MHHLTFKKKLKIIVINSKIFYRITNLKKSMFQVKVQRLSKLHLGQVLETWRTTVKMMMTLRVLVLTRIKTLGK